MSGALSIAKTQVEVYSHKLFAPTGYPGAIERTHILQRVLQQHGARVVILQAPAGHGKTTALQQLKSLCETDGYVTGWLTFDEADNDPRRFSVHLQALIASLIGADPAAAPPDDPEELIGPRQRSRSDWVIDRLLKLGRPIGLFLDEFQVLGNPSVLAFCRDFFEHIPANARVFVGSRSVPDIGLARLLVNNQAMLLRAEDLRFSRREVEQFFAAAQGVDISREEVESVYLQTEGWPAAIQLFRLGLANPEVRRSLADFASSRPRELTEYLADSVLSLQAPRVQEFLLRTSLLGRLNASLCDAVTGWHHSQELLLWLERSGLFLRSLDVELRWFKYHGLFSSFLADQLRAGSADIVNEVHERASCWYLENQLYEEAAYHAIAGGNFARAVEALNLWSSSLVSLGHLMTVERWFNRIPLAEIARCDELLVKSAYALTFLHRQTGLRPVEELLDVLSRRYDGVTPGNPDIALAMAAMSRDHTAQAFSIVDRVEVRNRDVCGFGAFEFGAAANMLGYRAITSGDFDEGREYLALARFYSDRGQATFSRGYSVALVGVSFLLQGHLDEALERFRAGMAEHQSEIDKSFASAALASCYAWALYEADDFDTLEALFCQHHEAIAESAMPDFAMVSYLAMARMFDASGRPGKATEVLDEAETICRANNWTQLLRVLGWERARRAALAGDLPRAVKILAGLDRGAAAEARDWLPFTEEMAGQSLCRIRILIDSGELAEASGLLAAALTAAAGRSYRQIKLLVLEALLQRRKGQHNAAHRALRKALQLAEQGGYLRLLLDEGAEIVTMLQAELQALPDAAAGPGRAFVEQLLLAAGVSGTAPTQPEPRTIDALTEREKEILMFLANGVSNREMAQRIFVSENTIKFHLKNIYSKLGVGSRVQAITAGRQIGLIG